MNLCEKENSETNNFILLLHIPSDSDIPSVCLTKIKKPKVHKYTGNIASQNEYKFKVHAIPLDCPLCNTIFS